MHSYQEKKKKKSWTNWQGVDWVNHGATAQLNHVITTCIYSEIACWFHFVGRISVNLDLKPQISWSLPTYCNAVLYFWSTLPLYGTISISQKCLQWYKGHLQFAEGSQTWKGETAFTLEHGSWLLAQHSFQHTHPSPSETIKGHLMSPLGAERFSLATKADRSPQTKYLLLLHYALCQRDLIAWGIEVITDIFIILMSVMLIAC